ncbi:MAG TPA: hypothetical protein VFX70_06560 [Mycobacteriales bacterium]|nr:hypothetical protein [Mycobacteriales bacterium]
MSDRLYELLVRAVRQLDQAEQDEVLGALLSGVGARTPVFEARARRSGVGAAALAERITMAAGDTGDLKVLPVRLPVADYERLRTWAREHEFSMAVIVRTLVERFLDGQDAPRPGDGEAAAPPDPADQADAAE